MNETKSNPNPGRRPYVAVIGFFLLLAVIAVIVLVPRLNHKHDLETEAHHAGDPPLVLATRVKAGASSTKLELPGNVQAFEQATIYARTNGYLKARYVDIGDHVRKGQLLALIEDPTTAQSLRQAQANVVQLKAQLTLAQANSKLADVNNTRWQQLYQQGVVSKLDADTRQATAGTTDATVEAAQANIAAGEAAVKSLEEQMSFSRVTAPFDGVVLSRGVDVGSLISSGSSSGTTQMFTIGRADTVRVFSSVPQAEAVSIKPGHTAKVSFRELPGHAYTGAIARTSASVDLTSRTLLAEVDLKNDGKILPGMYATIQFDSPRLAPPVLLPTNALVVRNAGPQTFIVEKDGTVHLHSLVLGRDLSTAVEVVEGLRVGDTVVLSPNDTVVEGGKVQVKLQQ